MTTAIPITTDTLPNNVPKLDVKGTNWAIFSLWFQVTVEAKELWGHFDGQSENPAKPLLSLDEGSRAQPLSSLDDDEIDELAKWTKNESLAKHLLVQRIPNSTALHV
jgi:hypothetical protein